MAQPLACLTRAIQRLEPNGSREEHLDHASFWYYNGFGEIPWPFLHDENLSFAMD